MPNKEKDDYLTSIAKTYFGTYAVFGIVFGLLTLTLIIPAMWGSFSAIFKAVNFPNKSILLLAFLIMVVWFISIFFIKKIKNPYIRIALIVVWALPLFKYLN